MITLSLIGLRRFSLYFLFILLPAIDTLRYAMLFRCLRCCFIASDISSSFAAAYAIFLISLFSLSPPYFRRAFFFPRLYVACRAFLLGYAPPPYATLKPLFFMPPFSPRLLRRRRR